jgi:hypothetical protein
MLVGGPLTGPRADAYLDLVGSNRGLSHRVTLNNLRTQ